LPLAYAPTLASARLREEGEEVPLLVSFTLASCLCKATLASARLRAEGA